MSQNVEYDQVKDKVLVCLDRLLLLAEKKRSSIVAGHHRELGPIVKEESETYKELKLLNLRLEAEHQLLDSEETKNRLAELKVANDMNTQLLRHSLQYIEFALETFSGAAESVTYGRGGSPVNARANSARTLVDRKA